MDVSFLHLMYLEEVLLLVLLNVFNIDNCLDLTCDSISVSCRVREKTIHCTIVSYDFTAVSVAREVLRSYIVEKNSTHFSAFRHDRVVL